MHMHHVLFFYYLPACLHKTYSVNAELSVSKGLTETDTEGPLLIYQEMYFKSGTIYAYSKITHVMSIM